LGIQGQDDLDPNNPARRYYHGDMIGSTMTTSDPEGNIASPPVAYTAFGEQVWHDQAGHAHIGGPLPAGFPRYAYAGAYGYESGPWGQTPDDEPSRGPLVLYGANRDLPPITLLHVGERWYQPGIGRFVQRDPIGLGGGVNMYLYVWGNPLDDVDADGLAAPYRDHRSWVRGYWRKSSLWRAGKKFVKRWWFPYQAGKGVVYVAYCIAGHKADYRDPGDELIGLGGDLINLMGARAKEREQRERAGQGK
jgi:RHS repeat-associated protein